MFDSLKEKLGSFRDDVEETADEKAEPVEEGEEIEETELPETESGTKSDVAPDDGVATEEAATATGAESEASAGLEREEPDLEPAPEPGPGDPVSTDPGSSDEESADAGTAIDESSENEVEASIDPGAGDEEASAGFVEPGEDADDADETPSEGSEGGEYDPSIDSEDEAEGEDDEDEADVEESNATGFGRKARSLVRGKFVIEEEDVEEPLEDLELALLSSDVEMGVTEEILENIREELIGETRRFRESTGEVVEEALRDAIYDVISVGQFDFERRVAEAEKPLVIVFTGVNGVGKTTTIAKLSRYLEERGFSSVLANGDTYRAGANEQIREHAAALDRRLIAHDQGGDPAAVLYDAVEYAEANDVDVVLGDTAGRLHTDEGLMDQLKKIDRVVGPDMALFVDEAVAGQDAVNRAREFDAAAPFDGAVLTKADADSNGGAAISIAHVTGKPVLFLGTGQGYDDIERFEPDRMIDRLLDEE